MEFLALVTIVVVAMLGVVGLTMAGHGDVSAIATLTDIVKIGFGAIVALAYAARGMPLGVKPPPPGGQGGRGA